MDPNAKKSASLKRYLRALTTIKQGAQLNQWSVIRVEEDTDVFLVGKKEMVQYVKELLDEAVRPQAPAPSATGSLELGASDKNDSEASHAEESLSEAGPEKDFLHSEGQGLESPAKVE